MISIKLFKVVTNVGNPPDFVAVPSGPKSAIFKTRNGESGNRNGERGTGNL